MRGLYTSTCFRYDPRLFEKLGPALELGRSFVRPEYQRQYAPLLLLWKGIARLLAAHAQTPVLFGAVSISNDYNKASREMIYRFFEARIQEDELGGDDRGAAAVSSGNIAALGLPRHVPRTARSGRPVAADHRRGN